MNDQQIIQQWDTYIQEYEEKYRTIKQEADTIINDPNASNERKAQAIRDVQGQGEYLNQLKANKALLDEAYANEQPLPNVTFDVLGAGMVCKKTGDSTIYPLTIDTAMTATELHYAKTDFTDIYQYTDMTYYGYSWTNSYPGKITQYKGFNSSNTFMAFGHFFAQTSGSFDRVIFNYRDALNYFSNQSGDSNFYNNHTFYLTAQLVSVTAFNINNVPTLPQGARLPNSYFYYETSNPSNPTQYSAHIALGIKYDYGSETQDPYEDNPWDYYNDNIKDNIANDDDKVFPEGYSPTDPDEPGNEPKDLPHDDGTPTDLQERTLVAPTQFITQYILDSSQLYNLGDILWSTWLTPNTTIWKNFVYHFNALADTGTFDVSMMFNFIISLRVYPFDLISLTAFNWITGTDGVYMGTGHTNFLPGNIAILNTTIGWIDAGNCTIQPEMPYDDFRDMYNCSITCFLPYCGNVELTPAEVIGREINVRYLIDFQSGGCTAVIRIHGDKGWYLLASKSGQIGFMIPMTATNAGQVTTELIKDATQAAGTIGGFFFDLAKNKASNYKSLLGNLLSKHPKSYSEMEADRKLGNIGVAESGFDAGLSLINQASDMLSRSGIDVPFMSGGSGAESMLFPDKCTIQIRRGKYCKPDNYPHSVSHLNCSSNTIEHYKGAFKGTPATGSNTGKGLCKFTGIDTTGLTCHDDERAEIVALLEAGIYL